MQECFSYDANYDTKTYQTSPLSTVPPSLYPDSDVDVNAARGSTVSFQFQVSGQPEPNVVWERGSQRLATGDRVVITTNEGVTTLTIHEITREDEGLYVCCAMNHLGNTVQECQITLLGQLNATMCVDTVRIIMPQQCDDALSIDALSICILDLALMHIEIVTHVN